MNIANLLIWMRKEAYGDRTTRKVAEIRICSFGSAHIAGVNTKYIGERDVLLV
jgi:hypothetical protein